MKNERRSKNRKDLDPIAIEGLISIMDLNPIADHASLVEASPTGFRLFVERTDLVDENLKHHLSLEAIEGLEISLFIPAMNLDMTGVIVRTRHRGGGIFELGIDYTADAPEYWRHCLCDLLPTPGELAS